MRAQITDKRTWKRKLLKEKVLEIGVFRIFLCFFAEFYAEHFQCRQGACVNNPCVVRFSRFVEQILFLESGLFDRSIIL